MEWYWFDLAILFVIGLSVITGLFRGFIKELIALCVWIASIWLAFAYSPQITPLLRSYIHNHSACIAVSFVVILLGSLFAGGLLNASFGLIVRHTGLSGADRLLGMGFGFVRGVFIVALIMLVVKVTSIPYEKYSQHSQLYARFDPIVNWMYSRMPTFIQQVKAFDKDNINEIDLKPVLRA